MDDADLAAWGVEVGVPGAAVAVVTPAATRILTAGVADVRTRSPITETTVFDAASLTKQVFARAVRALAAAGHVDLDAPLATYWLDPQLAGDPRSASVTARMALAHASGLHARRAEGTFLEHATPGSRWHYSGQGYEWVRQAVEQVTSQTLARLVDDLVFQPLGMHDSWMVWQPEMSRTAASGHGTDGQWIDVVRPSDAVPSASMQTTALDYARFLRAELDEIDLLAPVVTIDDALSWAAGWGLERCGGRWLGWQWGDNPGWKHIAVIEPGVVAVAVLTNGDRGYDLHPRVVQELVPGDHPALTRRGRPGWELAMATPPDDVSDRLDDLVEGGLVPADLAQPGDAIVGYVTDHRWGPLGLPPDAVAAVAVVDLAGERLRWIAVAEPVRSRGIAGSLVYGIVSAYGLDALSIERWPNELDVVVRRWGFDDDPTGGLVLAVR